MNDAQKALIGDRYRILHSVDEGGTSYIFLVQDIKLDKQYAMKLLKPELSADPQYAKAFKKEIKLLKKLNHPNIAHLVNYGFQGSFAYYIMEYVEGCTLKSYIEQGILTMEQKIEIAEKICSAMEYAHSMGVVHRDLKPANVMLDACLEPIILDFGTAEAAESGESAQEEVFGTVEYFSPEQAKGEKTDKYTDIYSMGILLYELMTGKLPFTGEEKVAIALKQIHQTPDSPCLYAPDLPHSIEHIILKALRKQKSDRYQSFMQMRKDLEKALRFPEGAYIKNYREQEEHTNRKARRHGSNTVNRFVILGVLTVILAVVILNLWSSVSRRKTEAVYMPALQNKTLEEAQRIVEQYDLELEYTYEANAQVEEGRILSQTPQMGVLVERGEKVQAVVSLGAGELLDMPNLIGMDEQNAEETLRKVGFTQVVTEGVYDAAAEDGEVVGQYPDSGERVSADATVVLQVNHVNSQLAEVIPQLVGQDMFTAVSQASEAGFGRVLINMIDMAGSPGQVVAQYPTSDMIEISLAYMELTVQQPSSVCQLQVEIPGGAVSYHQDAYMCITAAFWDDQICYEFIVDEYTCKDSLEFEKLFADGESYRMSLDTKFKDMDYTIYIYLNGEVVYTKQYMS